MPKVPFAGELTPLEDSELLKFEEVACNSASWLAFFYSTLPNDFCTHGFVSTASSMALQGAISTLAHNRMHLSIE